MNVEMTMEFILGQQEQMAARLAEAAAHLTRTDRILERVAEHQAATDTRLAKVDKRLDSIAVIIKAGVKLMGQMERKINILVDSQQRLTDALLR